MPKTLSPVTPAWRAGDNGLTPILTTEMPPRLKRRGFLPSWPAPGVVTSVDGLVPEAVVAAGVTIVWDTVSNGLFRYDNGAWRSVSGHSDVLLPAETVGGYAGAYAGGY